MSIKHRWVNEPITKESIEALTGRKVLRITSGELDTNDPEVKEKGIEIEFDEDPALEKLEEIDEKLRGKFVPRNRPMRNLPGELNALDKRMLQVEKE